MAKLTLTPNVKLFEVEAPAVARKARPGHFVILRIHEKGERIPITIAGTDPGKGTVTIVFAEVGKTSKQLGALEEGDAILNFAGPLGNPLKVENYGTVLCVGGGVMVGALLYQISALRKAGNKIVSVVGARSAEHLIFVEEVRRASDELHVATDDGSEERRGLDFLEGLLKETRFDHVFTIGPTSMQRAVAEMTRPHGIPTTVNLFPIMVDGTGMCGACRVTVGGETKFACIDGPDFDGHQVDFDELISRMRVYTPHEKIAMVLHDEEAS
ncbi:MAG: sulfide/dihydroorotate dehydrogenase-like FAD/NAD-binding protein [Candidatus Bathyarchaeia archaeon]